MNWNQVVPDEYVIAVLIDTWWNVNIIILLVPASESGVLIDTWWNVNENLSGLMSWIWSVLIDTWWNVNENLSALMSWIWSGFNRYMVECEWSILILI